MQECEECLRCARLLDILYGSAKPNWDQVYEWEDVLTWHREVHRLVQRAQLNPREPPFDDSDRRLVLRETGGITERSKAFYLVNRHRFGVFVAATMGDFEHVEGCLRLYDDSGRVLALSGCTAGCGGEGPAGSITVLRWSGFPEGEEVDGYTDLERLVRTKRCFRLEKPRPTEGAEGTS